MSLSSTNCSVIPTEPSALVEVISVMPGTELSATSSGVATAEAMVSALAPGNRAFTSIVGKSASGKGAIDSLGNARIPISTSAQVSSTVPIGWLMHQTNKPRLFIAPLPVCWRLAWHSQQPQHWFLPQLRLPWRLVLTGFGHQRPLAGQH